MHQPKRSDEVDDLRGALKNSAEFVHTHSSRSVSVHKLGSSLSPYSFALAETESPLPTRQRRSDPSISAIVWVMLELDVAVRDS